MRGSGTGLAEESILTDDFLRELMNVGEVDILVGVPTHNDAATVASVVQAIRAGLLKFFPRQRAVIINADGGSRDGTRDLVRAAAISDSLQVANLQTLRTLHSISTEYEGGRASGNALRAILEAADLLHASASVVISPDSIQIEPDWMEKLLRPVIGDNIDLVSPLYCRHKFDGLLIRNLLYPMTRALYGKRIREPYPADFAFSSRLAAHVLAQDIWSQEAARLGVELCMTLDAITANFKLSEVLLGDKPRIVHAGAELVPAMRQTVGVLFWSLEPNYATWSATSDSQPVPTVGRMPCPGLEPVRVNRRRLQQLFATGVKELEPVLKSILSSSTHADLVALAAAPEEHFQYSDELWVKSVYEFAAAYHKSAISRDHIVQALAPLYRGKTYTFLSETRDASSEGVEDNSENLCLEFERHKPYLLQLWDGRK